MTDFYWESDDAVRCRHLYIPGMSGFGKTSLMANLALDDIESYDHPVIVIDPKGSKDGLVARVVKHIPKELIPNVFYISLQHPVPIDIMNFSNQSEKNLIKGDIITILKRFSFGTWGTTMQDTLNNLVPTLLEASDTTFLDIGRFLESKKRRAEILEQVSEERQDYWKENPPTSKDTGPIAHRMSNFKDPPLSTIVSGKRGEGIRIADIIENNQVLLVDTSPLGDEGLMLGALIMSRIQQAIFRRDPNKPHPTCHVYADEFHNFQTSAFNVMLSQARSFNLSLCLANQHPKQISETWDDIKGCVSSYVLFRMDGEHATMLKSKIKEPPQPPKADLYAMKQLLKRLEGRAKYLTFLAGENISLEPTLTEAERAAEAEKISKDIALVERAIARAHKPKPDPITILDQIPSLPVGHAIYIEHTGNTFKIRTPEPPLPPPHNYLNEIIQHTKDTSAQSSQKRPGDKPSSNSTQVSHTEGNAPLHSTSEEVPPSGRARLPLDKRKKKGH